jgi:putative hydrolase of the HAD superfamily
MKETLVFFDAVGTLIYPSPPVYETYQSIGKKYGASLSEEIISERFKKSFKTYFSKDPKFDTTSSEKLEKQRWKNIVDDIFKQTSFNNPNLFHELWQHFSIPSHWKLYDDTKPVLEKLINEEIYVGLASNFDARILTICTELLPEIHASRIFYSTALGYAKPNVDFYKSIEHTIDADKKNFIMIGDDWENDIKAATNAGWTAIHRDNINMLYEKLKL